MPPAPTPSHAAHEALPSALAVLEVETGRVLWANARAREAFDLPLGEVLVAADVLPALRAPGARGIRAELRSARGHPVAVELDAGALEGASLLVAIRDRSELERLAVALRESQRMETVGALAGGIAHEFNNALQSILGYTDLCLEELPAPSELRDDLERVQRSARRARRLVRQLLTFTQQVGDDERVVSLRAAIDDALGFLRPSVPPHIEIDVLESLEGGDAVLGDPNQLQQIVTNLATNAYHAMRASGGRMEIALTETRAALEPELPEELDPGREYLVLTVTDQGAGMDAQHLRRAIEPLFSTLPREIGTGLGLPVVAGIARKHGGALRVTSVPGSGTIAEVHLPRHDSNEAGATPVEGPGEGAGLVLFIDDERDNADLGAAMLRRIGYDVELATGGDRALRAFELRPDAFVAIVSDAAMPGISGRELLERIRALRPDVPAVLMTGSLEASDAGADEFERLTKPFRVRELASVLEKAIGSSGNA